MLTIRPNEANELKKLGFEKQIKRVGKHYYLNIHEAEFQSCVIEDESENKILIALKAYRESIKLATN